MNRTGLLQPQESPRDDEPWELIKKEVESEDYLVVLPGGAEPDAEDLPDEFD